MSNAFSLPKWMTSVKKLYNTRSGGGMQPLDIALVFALTIREYNSANEIRRTAHRLVPYVCLEHRPNMKRLSRETDDEKVFEAALKIINRVCEFLSINSDQEFKRDGRNG